MRLFKGINKAEFGVLDARLSSIFAQFDHRVVIIALVVKFQTPWQIILLIDDFSELVDLPIPYQGVEKDADWEVPFERDSVVLEPHLLKAVGAVLHDKSIKSRLDLLQTYGQIVRSGQHHVERSGVPV